MCAPFVIDEVRQILSRRGFLSTLGGAAAVLAAAPTVAAAQSAAGARPVRLANGFRDVHDLTHTYSASLPVFPSFHPLRMTPKFSIAKDGFFASELTFDEHTGTHMDAPMHFIPGGTSADRLPVDRFFAPLVVFSIADRAAQDADTTVSVDDLLAWEKAHGRIPAGAFVAMYSGWEKLVPTPEKFINRDAKGVNHAPGFGGEAAEFLVKQRDIVGVGVDTLSLDATGLGTSVAHVTFLGGGKYGIELLANLMNVPPAGATVIVGGPKHEGASGGPTRVYAVV
jgi:kynurenine formamidase